VAEREASSRLLREVFLAGFMAGLSPENSQWASARLARSMSDVRLAAGEVLYRRGDPSDAHFFIVTGAIRLEVEGKAPWLLAERSLVGTLDITLDRPRARDAIAARDAFLLRLPATEWIDMLEDNFELTLRAVQGLSDGLQRMRAELRDFEPSPLPDRPREAPPAGAVSFVERVFLLKRVALFASGESQALADLAEVADEVAYAAGERIPERSTNEALLLVVTGEVRAERGDPPEIRVYGPGQLVHGSAAAGARDLGYETTTTAPTRLLRIPREDYLDALEEHFGLARSCLKALAVERELLVDEKERRALTAPI
jgi:CRP-like cAMP-binding protein